MSYELFAYRGNELEKSVLFQSHSASIELVTTSETTPYPAYFFLPSDESLVGKKLMLRSRIRPSIDVQLTWLLNLIDDDHNIKFNIDRSSSNCHTPRRNYEIGNALRELSSLQAWGRSVNDYFVSHYFTVQKKQGLNLESVKDGTPHPLPPHPPVLSDLFLPCLTSRFSLHSDSPVV